MRETIWLSNDFMAQSDSLRLFTNATVWLFLLNGKGSSNFEVISWYLIPAGNGVHPV
jgi:hypothetical protein